MGKINAIYCNYNNINNNNELNSKPNQKPSNQFDYEDDDYDAETIDENQNKLEYRAEGNANIVLALIEKKQVLRLRKSYVDQTIATKDFLDLRRFIKYSRIISMLFSNCFVSEPKLAFLCTRDLDLFNKNLTKYRPVDRLDKEIRNCSGILYPDVAFLPPKLNEQMESMCQDNKINPTTTYCVEIKPKQGWSFFDDSNFDDGISYNSQIESPIFNFTPAKKCRYCLAQYLKLQKKSIHKVSKYCPLDLFSGKPLRILNAIKGLIGSPQNNFKIIKNGTIVYGDGVDKSVFNKILKEIFASYKTKEERKTIFMNFMKEILTKDFSQNDEELDRKVLTIRKDRKKKDKNLLHERVCNPINYQYLPQNCALKQILDAQLLVKSSLEYTKERKFQEFEDPYAYIDNLLHKFATTNTNTNDLNVKNLKERLNEQEKYMLGATALDCSIMITFRKMLEGEFGRLDDNARSHIVTIEHMKFLVNITVMDLDPKSQKHEDKYVKQMNTANTAYKEFMSKLKH